MNNHQGGPDLPLFNHEFVIRKAVTADPLPDASTSDAPYAELHNTHLYEVDGDEHYAIDLDLVASFLVKHKDNVPELDAIACVLHNRGVILSTAALKAGKTSPQELLSIVHKEAFFTADGPDRKRILPLDLLAVSRIYGFHHGRKRAPQENNKLSGGEYSKRAITALDEFLAAVGLQPNHDILKLRFCTNCRR